MKTPKPYLFVLCAVAGVLLLSSCHSWWWKKPRATFECAGFPQLQPNLPGDVDVPSHPNVQCFAWQELIALNWPARADQPGEPDRSRGPRDFGRPGDTTPGVWETYKEAHEVFLPNGSPPSPWGVSGLAESLPASFVLPPATADAMKKSGAAHVFRMNTMISPAAPRLERVFQADTGWLTAQNRTLTHYGIHMNRTEFDYIVGNRFYDAQAQCGAFVNLPAGRTGNPGGTAEEGAIEIKSAWVEIRDPALWPRYRMADACIVEGDHCRSARVGLVGLHILHKTETFPQWSWATFEHVDNAPDREEVRQGTLRSHYTYYNPACRDASRPECQENRRPLFGEPMDRPIQVVRETPLPESARNLNRAVHAMIRRANRHSVWQYYDLVDVQWPEAGTPIPAATTALLPLGGPTPSVLANSVVETYVQRQRHCLDCHRGATTACGTESPPRRSDYSFLFGMAAASH